MPVVYTCTPCGDESESIEALNAHQYAVHNGTRPCTTSFVPHVAVGEQRFVAKCRACGVTQERVGEQPPRICEACTADDHGPGCDGPLNCVCEAPMTN